MWLNSMVTCKVLISAEVQRETRFWNPGDAHHTSDPSPLDRRSDIDIDQYLLKHWLKVAKSWHWYLLNVRR